MVICPLCGRHTVGKVGNDQYYCWDCCVEFSSRDERVKVFSIESDGTLIQFANHPPVDNMNYSAREG